MTRPGTKKPARTNSRIIRELFDIIDASKATCLWFYDEHGQPVLDMRLPVDPARRVFGRIVDGKERWSNQTDSGQNRLSPADDRWKDRSRTFPGIADAMATTWGLTLASACL